MRMSFVRLLFFTLSAFLATFPALHAQNTKQVGKEGGKKETSPVFVTRNGVDFHKVQLVSDRNVYWLRIEVLLETKKNETKDASNANWVRDVEVDLSVIYQDKKGLIKDRKDKEEGKGGGGKERMLAMKSKARIFGVEAGGIKTPVVFYIPGEVVDVHGIDVDKEPFAWHVEVTAGGLPVEINEENYKSMFGGSGIKKLLKSAKTAARALENFKEAMERASAANDRVLLPLNECPVYIQNREPVDYTKGNNPAGKKTGANSIIPTYLPTR